MARVFVTRRLPGSALERLTAEGIDRGVRVETSAGGVVFLPYRSGARTPRF
jgi:hypothetical protein